MLYIARYKIRPLILITKRNIIKDDIIHIRKNLTRFGDRNFKSVCHNDINYILCFIMNEIKLFPKQNIIIFPDNRVINQRNK